MGIFYIGVTCYGNLATPDDTPKMPDVSEAGWMLQVQNTGKVILAQEVNVMGDEEGKRLFSLNGYWELAGNRFIYRDRQTVIDERIFGRVSFQKR